LKTEKSHSEFGGSSYGNTSSKKSMLPFPFLDGLLLNAKAEGRILKRMDFSYEPKEELVQFISSQITEKKQKDLIHKVDQVIDDRKDQKLYNLNAMKSQ
jgi:hypothetical protein